VYVPSLLFVHGDTDATSRNIVASEWLFRSGIVSHLISQIIVPFLALAMYRLLKHVNKEHAAAMVVMALLCVPISFVAEVNNLAALRLFIGAGEGAFTGTQLQTQAMLSLDMRPERGPARSDVLGARRRLPGANGSGSLKRSKA
jgi:Domain of unknown function (DUF4386)